MEEIDQLIMYLLVIVCEMYLGLASMDCAKDDSNAFNLFQETDAGVEDAQCHILPLGQRQ